MCGSPEVHAVGGSIPTPPPLSCHQANKRELGVQIWLPSWLRKEEEEGWRLPGQLCPTQIWCVSLQYRSAFAGQTRTKLEAPGPQPRPALLCSLPGRNKLAGPKNTERPAGQTEQPFHFAQKREGNLKLSKGFISPGVGPRSRLKFSWPGQTQLLALQLPTGTFPHPDSDSEGAGECACSCLG